MPERGNQATKYPRFKGRKINIEINDFLRTKGKSH